MLDRIAELFIFGFTPLVIGMLAVPGVSGATEQVVRGEVLYRERIALPPNAVLSVQLADVSRADAPAAILGEQKIVPAGQVPIKFEIKFDPSVIQTNMSYALQARITVDDKLWFITDTRHQVDPLSREAQTVMVRKVAQQDEPTTAQTIYGKDWVAELVDGVEKLPERRATFRIEQTGAITGKGFCNGYFASARIDASSLVIGQAGSTQMACEPELMAADAALFEAFAKAGSYNADADGLVIADKDGRAVLRFKAP
ncbi:YbaY family lipoprotein [Mesorhizobium sp. A556]